MDRHSYITGQAIMEMILTATGKHFVVLFVLSLFFGS
jgi:hypothetical protein